MLGLPGEGNRIAVETLNEGRVGIAAQLLGLAESALQTAIEYSQKRHQFGQPICSFQAVQFSLARMATKVEAARLLVYNAARLIDSVASTMERFQTAAMAKYYASLVAEEVASESVEVLGGNGFTRDFPLEKFYRDAKIGRIYEGTTNMQLRTIATTLVQNAQRTAAGPR
jgi:butyryl-CoA dehydrogenase/short/branched chain acyl-CoA dehydrogenase